MPVDGARVDVIQAPKPVSRIKRYELRDYEWTAIKPMLPSKPRVRRLNDRRVLMASKRKSQDPIYLSPHLYRTRDLIERFFNKIEQCRRVATRYRKLATNYLAFIKVALAAC